MQNKNQISLVTAILLNINIMVGAAIFVAPPLMAAQAGGMSYLGWLISALIVLPIIMSVAHISSLLPGEGSFYSYSKHGIGQSAGFLSGWIYFLGYVSTQALQMLAMRNVLMYQLNIQFIHNHTILFNALFFFVLSLLCCFKLTIVSAIQSASALLKLVPIVLFGIVALILFPGIISSWTSGISTFPSLNNDLSFTAALGTLPFAIFGFWGFESCTHIGHAIKDGAKNAGRAIIIGFSITALIYFLAHIGLYALMGQENLSVLGVTAFAEFLPIPIAIKTLLTLFITFAVLLSYTSAIFGEINNNSFLMYAMAKENLIFCSKTLRMTNKHNQPIAIIFLQAILAFLFVTIINHLGILIAISNLGLLTGYSLTIISLLLIQLRKRITPRIIITLMGLVSCGVISVYSWNAIPTPSATIPFFLILALGIVMYGIQTSKLVKETK